MIRVNIIGEKYSLPTHPREISFEEFVSINTYIAQHDKIEFEEKLDILSLIMKCERSVLTLIEDQQINALYDAIYYLHRAVDVKELKNFRIGKEIFTVIDLESLSVREYADIDFYFRDGESPYENLDKIFGILIRKVTARKKKIKNIFRNKLSMFSKKMIDCITEVISHESYEERTSLKYADLVFENFTAENCISLFKYLTDYRDSMVKRYGLVFTKSSSDELDEELPEVKSVSEIWGLYNTVSSICENDKQKIDYWMERPIKELFTHLSYLKQYNLENQKK